MSRQCPKCSRSDTRCWDERRLDWWYPNGECAGTQMVGMFACNDCGHAWAVPDPPNVVMREGDASPTDEDDRWVYS